MTTPITVGVNRGDSRRAVGARPGSNPRRPSHLFRFLFGHDICPSIRHRGGLDHIKGYELAVQLKPDLILLDINLPGLSGFEVATKLRQNPAMDGALIVALTAKTMRSDRETALVTGCDGFISKPIDPFLFVGQVVAYDRATRELSGGAAIALGASVGLGVRAGSNDVRQGRYELLP